MRSYFLIWLLLLSFSFLDAQNINKSNSNSILQLTGEDYMTGEDGVPRMNINLWGHVKYPGSYLVYDSIDLFTCLSMAGGPMSGAKLSEIIIISKDGQIKKINLESILETKKVSKIKLKPHDTIYVEETLGNYLLARSNVINILLQITNLILISTNNR